MKNGENGALAEKTDRIEGKMDRIAKKKDKKNAMEKLPSHVKKSMLIFIFYRLCLTLLKHLA
jgi:hypothetical protein